MNDHQSITEGVIKAMTTQGGTVAKAQQVCMNYAAGKLSIYQWHDLMMQIHYQDCKGDPIQSGWIQCQCSHLVSEQDWEWSVQEDLKDSKHYQQKFKR